ncbi:MAG: PD-(D/E)XK nuclease family protein [Planctomycetota bacterium]|nr:PD-(D/E)XK nuclease family protein [Planctomycetota bacterium]
MTEGTRWSYSRLAAYLTRCSLQYYFRYVAKIEPERTSSRLAFGSAIHTGLEAAHRSWKSGEPVPLEVAQAAFAADLVIRLQDPILEFREGETPESLLDQGKALLTAWAAKAVYQEVIDTEHEFSVPVVHPKTGEILDAELTGIIDLLVKVPGSASPLVIDFKTSARKYSASQLDMDLQAAIYSYAIRHIYGVDTVPMQWQILVKTKRPGIQKIEFVRDSDGDARLFELVRAAERGVAAGVFHPNDGSMWCSGCPFTSACSRWEENPNAIPVDFARALSRTDS